MVFSFICRSQDEHLPSFYFGFRTRIRAHDDRPPPTTKFWKCQSINVEHKMHLFMMVAVPNGAKTLASAVKNLVIGKCHLHSSGLLNKLVLNWQLFLNYIYYLGGKVFYLVFKIKCKSLLDPPFISDMIEIRLSL